MNKETKIEQNEVNSDLNSLFKSWTDKLVLANRHNNVAARLGAYTIARVYDTGDYTIDEAITEARKGFDEALGNRELEKPESSFRNGFPLIPFALSILRDDDGELRDWNSASRLKWPSITKAKNILKASKKSFQDCIDTWESVAGGVEKLAESKVRLHFANDGFPDYKPSDKEIDDKVASLAREASTSSVTTFMDNEDKVKKDLVDMTVKQIGKLVDFISFDIRRRGDLDKVLMIITLAEKAEIDAKRSAEAKS